MWNKALRLFINNFYLLGATAFPGAHKLITLLIVTYLFNSSETGNYVNDIFIVYIFGFFSVFNWSTFILAEMPKLPKVKQPLFFGKIFWLSLSLLVLIIPLGFLLAKLGFIVSIYSFLLFLITWSFYQLWRHYFIARVKYKKLFYADLLLLFSTIGSIILARKFNFNVLGIQSIALVVIPFIFKILGGNNPSYFVEFRMISKIDWRVYKRSLNYSLINLSTGGIQLFLAPLSYQLLSSEFTAIIGLTNNMAALALLIPRAISYNYLPELPKYFRHSMEQFILNLKDFQNKINLTTLTLLVIGLLFQCVWFFYFADSDGSYLILSFLVYANLLTSQLSLPWSNGMVISGSNKLLLKINVGSFFIYCFSLFGLLNIIEDPLVVLISATILNIFINFGRYKVMERINRNELCLTH